MTCVADRCTSLSIVYYYAINTKSKRCDKLRTVIGSTCITCESAHVSQHVFWVPYEQRAVPKPLEKDSATGVFLSNHLMSHLTDGRRVIRPPRPALEE